MTHHPTRRVFNLGLAATLATPTAFAQAWPAKPIRLIVPYPPGGFTDVTARLIGQKLQERLGQTIVVENKAGANGTIGVADLARSAPDGYSFVIVIAAHAANPSLYAKLPYDNRNDLAAVSLIGVSPLVAAVKNDAPFKNAKELVAYAKQNPGKVSFGSSGNGAAAHLTTELDEHHRREHEAGADHLDGAESLTENHRGEADSGHRLEGREDGCGRGACVAKSREEGRGRHDGGDQGDADDPPPSSEGEVEAEPSGEQGSQGEGQGGPDHHQGRQRQGWHLLDGGLSDEDVDGVGEGRGESEGDAGGAERQGTGADQHQSGAAGRG